MTSVHIETVLHTGYHSLLAIIFAHMVHLPHRQVLYIKM